jgi:hypothetical protein
MHVLYLGTFPIRFQVRNAWICSVPTPPYPLPKAVRLVLWMHTLRVSLDGHGTGPRGVGCRVCELIDSPLQPSDLGL